MTQSDDPLVAMMMAVRDAQAARALEHESVRESAEYQEALASVRHTVVGLFKTLNLCEFASETRTPLIQPLNRHSCFIAAIANDQRSWYVNFCVVWLDVMA
jgi:hypothetical protein